MGDSSLVVPHNFLDPLKITSSHPRTLPLPIFYILYSTILVVLDHLVLDAHILPAAGTPNDVHAVLELADANLVLLPTSARERVPLRVLLVREGRKCLEGDVLAYPGSSRRRCVCG